MRRSLTAEDKGLVSSRSGEKTEYDRGGRARKFYHVEPEGVQPLRESRRALLSMWDGLEGVLEEG